VPVAIGRVGRFAPAGPGNPNRMMRILPAARMRRRDDSCGLINRRDLTALMKRKIQGVRYP